MKKTVDPITSFRKRCVDAGLLTSDEIKAVDKAVKLEIESETEKALSSPEPGMDTIADHITITDKSYHVRACHNFASYEHHKNM
jgi:TPP-dependent pyruvate/acetoin dehydrogenase alpha subunit